MSSNTKVFSLFQTLACGFVMGGFAYSFSFSVVPILNTLTSLVFGRKSLITIYATAVAPLIAGYLHTYASRLGMFYSFSWLNGIYIATRPMKNRRAANESRMGSIKRFVCEYGLNAFILSFMWETFTVTYLVQSSFIFFYLENFSSSRSFQQNSTKIFEPNDENMFILINGSSRFLAGLIAGMSTAIINQLWQRRQSRLKPHGSVLAQENIKLPFSWSSIRSTLSPFNTENWIKVASMLVVSSFVLLSSIPNPTNFDKIFTEKQKKFIGDILVIHGGWFYIRDILMLTFMKKDEANLKDAQNPPHPASAEEIIPLQSIGTVDKSPVLPATV